MPHPLHRFASHPQQPPLVLRMLPPGLQRPREPHGPHAQERPCGDSLDAAPFGGALLPRAKRLPLEAAEDAGRNSCGRLASACCRPSPGPLVERQTGPGEIGAVLRVRSGGAIFGTIKLPMLRKAARRSDHVLGAVNG